MSLVLYNAPVSTCSQKVRMTLHEKGLDWQDRRMSFQKGEHLADWYLKLNPNGVVPTLVHDGGPVVDSSVINEYLEDAFPQNPLRPADLRERAAMRAWRQYIDEVPTAAIRVPSFQLVFRKIWDGMSEEEFKDHADQLPLRKHFYHKMSSGKFKQEDMEEALDKLKQTIDRMEHALSTSGSWLVGNAISLADISVMPTIVRLDDLGFARLWDQKPQVAAWYERITSRPAFAKTYPPESRDLTPAV